MRVLIDTNVVLDLLLQRQPWLSQAQLMWDVRDAGRLFAYLAASVLTDIFYMVLGVALRWWAIAALGRYFTLDVAVRSTQAVVQTGPYRFVRHPAYSGTLLTLLGVGLALANWASLVAILAGGLIGHLYRVSVEERALKEALGQPYADYMRRTKRFVPFLV